MDANSIPPQPDNSRSPGQRPHWCHQTHPDDTGTDRTTNTEFFAWSRMFGPEHERWGIELVAEDALTVSGATAHAPRVYAHIPERGGLSLEEAELIALTIIDAVKAAREGGQR